jgi:hypothetical protein
MIPDEVCHYTKKKTALRILASEKLQISKLKSTNVLRESKPRNFPMIYRVDLSTTNDPKRDKKITALTNSSNRVMSCVKTLGGFNKK